MFYLCCQFISDDVTWGLFLLFVPYKSWATCPDFSWSADASRILHTLCFDKELVHCFLFPALRKVTTDKEICGCFQPSGRMTNKQTSLSSKKCTTWKGVLLHDLLHHLPAASVLLWPPFHVLVLVLAARQLMQTQELLVKSSQTRSRKKYLLQSPRRSEAAPMFGTLPVLLLWTWFILPSTLSIFGQKNGQVVGGIQSRSNFSASVAITFKSLQ